MTNRNRKVWMPAASSRQVYELEVCLLSGHITKRFVEENPIVSRTIQIRGDQTLEDFHDAIFRAFDRWEQHMYEFQVGGKGPMDPKARRYVLSKGSDDAFDNQKPAGVVKQTTIDALGLKMRQAFGYWFDFGDDWWHQINVIAIREGVSGGKYPKVTVKIGDSPPQYPDPEDEEEDDEDEE